MQLEARVLAHFSHDPFLLSFLSAGRDLHRLVASRMKGCYSLLHFPPSVIFLSHTCFLADKSEEEVTEEERDVAKHVVYGILYGIGATSLSEILQVQVEQAKAYIGAQLSS